MNCVNTLVRIFNIHDTMLRILSCILFLSVEGLLIKCIMYATYRISVIFAKLFDRFANGLNRPASGLRSIFILDL
jgi:hypothetical protein